MNIDLVNHFLELDTRKKDLQDQLSDLQAEYDRVNQALVDELTGEGIKSISVQGKTLYLHAQVWAHARADLDMVEILREEGLSDCLMVSTQRISSLVREGGETEFFQLHPQLKDIVKLETRVSVRVRKGT